VADTAVDAVAIRDAVEIFYGKLLGDPALSGMWQHVDMVIAHLIDSLREVGVAPDVVERARTDLQRLRPLIVRR